MTHENQPDKAQDCPGTGSNCVPFNQQNAKDFLRGKGSPVMERYAPDSKTGEHGYAGWQETDDTVERLRQWREEAPYG